MLESQGNRAKKNFYLFTGREYLLRLGMYDYRARIYDPRAGRFVQRDPLCENTCLIKISEFRNKYVYALQNPIIRIDPSGLLGVCICILGDRMPQTYVGVPIGGTCYGITLKLIYNSRLPGCKWYKPWKCFEWIEARVAWCGCKENTQGRYGWCSQ